MSNEANIAKPEPVVSLEHASGLPGICERIREVADALGSRVHAAEVAKLSTDQLALYLNGKCKPGLAPVARMAQRSGFSLDWICTGQGAKRIEGGRNRQLSIDSQPESSFLVALGKRIKEVRAKLSHEKFAESVGIHRSSLIRYEAGERSPDAEFLRNVCQRYGQDPNWLLLGQALSPVTRLIEEDNRLQEQITRLQDQIHKPGSLSLGIQVRALLSRMIRESPHNRDQIARRMSELTGQPITVASINAWTGQSRTPWRFPLEYAVAFEEATQSRGLTDLLASLHGGRVLVGEDLFFVDLARVEAKKQAVLLEEQSLLARRARCSAPG